MDEIIQHWRLVFIPAILYLAAAVAATRRLTKTLDELDGAIRSRTDLADLGHAINFNMAAAAAVGLLAFSHAAALHLLMFAGWLSPTLLLACVGFAHGPGFVCARLYTRRVETRARNLSVFCRDPEIEATYRRWLGQWGRPRLHLS